MARAARCWAAGRSHWYQGTYHWCHGNYHECHGNSHSGHGNYHQCHGTYIRYRSNYHRYYGNYHWCHGNYHIYHGNYHQYYGNYHQYYGSDGSSVASTSVSACLFPPRLGADTPTSVTSDCSHSVATKMKRTNTYTVINAVSRQTFITHPSCIIL